MTWAYTDHRFDSEAAYLAALAALGWGDPAAPPAAQVFLTPNPVSPSHPGFYVMAAWQGIDVPASFMAVRVFLEGGPVFAGAVASTDEVFTEADGIAFVDTVEPYTERR